MKTRSEKIDFLKKLKAGLTSVNDINNDMFNFIVLVEDGTGWDENPEGKQLIEQARGKIKAARSRGEVPAVEIVRPPKCIE